MKSRVEWITAQTIVFLSSLGYAAAAQLCVAYFKLNKLDIAPYSILISALIALIIAWKKGWYSILEIKKNYKDFIWAGFCTKFIVVLGLASFVHPELNAALATVLLKTPLIPVAFYVDYKLGELLNFKDKIAFSLAITAIFVAIYGALCSGDMQTGGSKVSLLKSPWFLIPLILYCYFYAKRMPIIRKYAGNVRYTGNEQFFTVLWIFSLFFIFVPVVGYVFPDTQIGGVCLKMWYSLVTPNIKKLVAGFSIAIPFGIYASAVVWLLNSGRNASQAAIVCKALAGVGTAFAAIIVVFVKSMSSFNEANNREIFLKVFLSENAPSRYDWLSVGIFLCATIVSGLGSVERSRRKKRVQTSLVAQPSTI